MPSRRRHHHQERPPRPYALLHAGVRLLGWITSLAAILLLAFVCKEWSSKSQVIIAGAVGCAIAMLNDSWEILAVTDASFTVPRLATSRRVLHDLFALALCVGGIIMMWVSTINISDRNAEQRRQYMWLMASLWAVIAVIGWRLIFAVWGCVDCSSDARRAAARRQRRRRQNDPWRQMGIL
ncbi:uncharacterized protein QYS62_005306 [Fusarium acuminatum]|uniref:Transmembrane protein n=1 Tax=Fusarium acuminatum TaxID=5515 RepID=A0ABZ2WWK7_9HYPO